MCGIYGVWDKTRLLSQEKIDSASNYLSFRGPDDHGSTVIQHNNSNLFLGHYRLSIIDTSDRGHQPMFDSDNSVCITFNGEIYNYQDLREKLSAQCEFISGSDTEVILHAYKTWGIEKTLQSFHGMFALALYDFEKETLFIARDRLGVKPLYFAHLDNLFSFSSDLRVIRDLHKFDANNIDPAALVEFIASGYVSGPISIFKGIRKLEPGHFLEINGEQKIKESTFWNLDDFKVSNYRSGTSNIIRKVDDLLLKSVERRLVSDVPLGVFLSGGVDSSLLVEYISRMEVHGLPTFTIGFKESQFDEAPAAREIAKYFKTDHYEKYITEEDIITLIDEIPQAFDEPFADPAALPTMLISDFASKNVKVVLSGDGGDELFYGYGIHKYIYQVARMGVLSRNPLFSKIISLSTKYGFLGSIETSADVVKAFRFYRFHAVSNSLFKEQFDSRHPIYDSSNQKVMDQLSSLELRHYLLNDILPKTDRSTMYYSIEGRVPFLDHELVEYMLSLPWTSKFSSSRNKPILRELLNKNLPTTLINKSKMGFNTPLGDWIRSYMVADVEKYTSNDFLGTQGIFNEGTLNTLKARVISGNCSMDHTKVFWNYLQFQRWYERNCA